MLLPGADAITGVVVDLLPALLSPTSAILWLSVRGFFIACDCNTMRALAPPKLSSLTKSLWLSLRSHLMPLRAMEGRSQLSSLLVDMLSLPEEEEPLLPEELLPLLLTELPLSLPLLSLPEDEEEEALSSLLLMLLASLGTTALL